MKAQFILSCTCAAVLAFSLSSCSSQNSGSTNGYDTAEPVANGEIPPWIAEGSDPSYESGSYKPVQSSSYAYNPPSKPKVSSSNASKKTTAKSSSSSKTRTTASKKSSSKSTASKSRSYSVKKGDTLGAIARKNGTSVTALKKANGLKSDMIHINQKLTIPRSK